MFNEPKKWKIEIDYFQIQVCIPVLNASTLEHMQISKMDILYFNGRGLKAEEAHNGSLLDYLWILFPVVKLSWVGNVTFTTPQEGNTATSSPNLSEQASYTLWNI